MRISRITVLCACLTACACFVILVPLGRSQAASVQNSVNSDALQAATLSGGKLVFNFTLTVNSPIPKNGVIACQPEVDINESSGQSITEKGFVLAHLVSGSQWACSVTIPYSWALATPTTDKAVLRYKITIAEALQVLAANTSTTTSTVIGPLGTRETNQVIGAISIPLSGATTTENVQVTL